MEYGSGEFVYEHVDDWATLPAEESFVDVCRVCIDERDHVWVLNRSEKPVMEFTPAGDRVQGWGEAHFSERPHGMTIGPDGNIHCTDDGNHTVRTFSRSGELLGTLGTEGEASDTGFRPADDYFEQVASIRQSAGPFNRPTGVTVLDDGTTFVADGYGNARIHAFSPDGRLQDSWGEPGASLGQFRVPHAIEHDSSGQLWVADRENSRVQRFDTQGHVLGDWIQLIRPTDVAIAGDTVFVSELACRISVYGREGRIHTRWGNNTHSSDDPLFVAPHSVAVDSHGDVYVGEVGQTYAGVDLGTRAIHKFRRVT